MLETINDNFNQVNNSNLFETAACRKEAIQIQLTNDHQIDFVRRFHFFMDDDVPHFLNRLRSIEVGFLQTDDDIGIDDIYLRKMLLDNHKLKKFFSDLFKIWDTHSKKMVVFNEKETRWEVDFTTEETIEFFMLIDQFIRAGVTLEVLENNKYFIIHNQLQKSGDEFKGALHDTFYIIEVLGGLELNWPYIKNSIHEKLTK